MRTKWAAALGVGAGLVGVAVVAAWPAERPDIVLVVLDTVRAESTSLCGYGRPTTPVLERLQAEGWSTSCQMVTPGTWTTPSHASFFTGKSVVELQSGAVEPDPADTLVGRLDARGYHSVLLSANMVLAQPEWFSAGFDQVRIASSFSDYTGPALADALGELLGGAPDDAPLFLVVNIIDAHAPYPGIPRTVGWVPGQRPVQHRMWVADPNTPFNRYVSGAMSAEDAEAFTGRLRNGYDWGVHQADANLGRVLTALEAVDRLEGARVVVTSDHGEFVGEHGQVGHGDTLFEPGVRVPLLVRDPSGPVRLPSPFPGQQVFDLVLDGAVSHAGPPVSVTHFRDSARESWDGLAIWPSTTDKLVWRPDAWQRFDLAADPGELAPRALEEHAMRPHLESLVDRHKEALEARTEPDDDTMELLRAAGYIE
ncbi:MAG: hypothetical protein ACI8PZ_006642 [Myxococcota bacterium]